MPGPDNVPPLGFVTVSSWPDGRSQVITSIATPPINRTRSRIAATGAAYG
jgi:hypothetical protein